jgi:hypothetical protein
MDDVGSIYQEVRPKSQGNPITLMWRNTIGLSCKLRIFEYGGDTIMLVTALELIDPRQGFKKSTQFFNVKLSNLGHVLSVAVA